MDDESLDNEERARGVRGFQRVRVRCVVLAPPLALEDRLRDPEELEGPEEEYVRKPREVSEGELGGGGTLRRCAFVVFEAQALQGQRQDTIINMTCCGVWSRAFS